MTANKIDRFLDEYASGVIASVGESYKWWWNADTVLADMIASTIGHMRSDGTTAHTDNEVAQLDSLRRYMQWYSSEATVSNLSDNELRWLHTEAMWLIGQWFSRMWD